METSYRHPVRQAGEDRCFNLNFDPFGCVFGKDTLQQFSLFNSPGKQLYILVTSLNKKLKKQIKLNQAAISWHRKVHSANSNFLVIFHNFIEFDVTVVIIT